jgi:hypothetical protein
MKLNVLGVPFFQPFHSYDVAMLLIPWVRSKPFDRFQANQKNLVM